MADANIVLMFGHLLIQMGEFNKAQKYFDTVLSSNPNDEEIACIYSNFGRALSIKRRFSSIN
jgi:tetratricopeptide (TPR) repeat protein